MIAALGRSRRRHALGVALAAAALGGCAGYRLAPVATTHPAHPDGPLAPSRAPSRTLAYAPADVPAVQPVPAVAAATPDAHGHAGGAPREAGARTVVGEGEVISTVPASGQIVVDHDAIPGFMEAMTMGYRVDPPSLMTPLGEGDRIRFTIDVGRRAIVAIEKVK